MENNQDLNKGAGYASFALKRMIVAVIVVIGFLWAFSAGLRYMKRVDTTQLNQSEAQTHEADQLQPHPTVPADQPAEGAELSGPASHEQAAAGHAGIQESLHTPSTAKPEETNPDAAGRDSHQEPSPAAPQAEKDATAEKSTAPSAAHEQPAAHSQADKTHAPAAPTTTVEPKPIGVTFVEATMEPIEYELRNRFWGWRPNDVVNFTDNINYFQLGVLEVTRRTVVQLAERISRTGSTDAFNRHLENAMNGLMVNADRYWFPSPENKYKESLDDLETYRKQLLAGKASFYTRPDNLIPLLAAFEDLLGSCDENLVKTKEADGSEVGFFTSDNYFYYAKGVASAMATILEAIHHDFLPMLDNRHGSELLHHAMVSCQGAASLSPWLITNANLDGLLANHRANMAAPISHARFYLTQLIKTLST